MRSGGGGIRYFDALQGLPPWGNLGSDVVLDCIGHETVRAGAQAHLERGVKHALVSTRSKSKADCDAFLLADQPVPDCRDS